MMYLSIFWAIFIIFYILYSLAVIFKWNNLKLGIEENGIILIIGLISVVFIAIATNDPISFGTFQVPVELQWLGSLFASFFGAWQFYLKPLKERVIKTENDVTSIKTDVTHIKGDTELIKQKIFEECKITKK